MRKAAGMLMIFGGLAGSTFWVVFLNLQSAYGFLFTLALMVAVTGGYYTLRKKRWGWALAGAICSLIFPIFGIPAIILLVKSKGEFQDRDVF